MLILPPVAAARRIRRNIVQESDKREEYKNTHVEKKADYTAVAIAFIKYAAYVIIFFGFLWFLVKYILPFFE